jgi:hypothetical protein
VTASEQISTTETNIDVFTGIHYDRRASQYLVPTEGNLSGIERRGSSAEMGICG